MKIKMKNILLKMKNSTEKFNEHFSSVSFTTLGAQPNLPYFLQASK